MSAAAQEIDTREEATEQPLLEVRGLVTEFRFRNATVIANAEVSLQVPKGRTVGIVGESGSGKSVLCRSILRLLPSPPAFNPSGEVWFEGRDLLKLGERELTQVRGTRLRMIFQNPMTSLNPVWPIGDQLTEGLRVHYGLSARAARKRGIDLLRQVGIPSPRERYDDYPFQWSGGMLQRAMIAMAMAAEPSLLMADEPTTALDVTIQDQILALLMELQERTDMALVLVSHDMAVIAETSDIVVVMYAGRVIEVAPVKSLFERPRHPYTVGLISSIPHAGASDRLLPIPGQPPKLSEPILGCPFAERCQFASYDCRIAPVTLREIESGHATACLFPERIAEAH